MSKIIQGHGSPHPKYMFVSTAPGPEEEKAGRVFSGNAGDDLRGMISAAGIKQEDCYFDNVRQESLYIPEDMFIGPRAEERKREHIATLLRPWYSNLSARINSLAPSVVIPLGDPALVAITGRHGITKWRGSILDSSLCPGRKCVVALDPAFISRQWEMRRPTIWDFERAKEESATNAIRLPQWDIHIRPSWTDIEDAFHRLWRSDLIVYDIEGVKEVSALGLGDGTNWAICIPFKTSDNKPYWMPDVEVKLWRMIAELLANKAEKVAQNEPFDWINLRLYGVEVKNSVWDTLKMHNCIWAELPHSLAFLCSVYTRQPFYKDEGKSWEKGVSEDRFWIYNGTDVTVTAQCYHKLRQELKDAGLENYYYRHYVLPRPALFEAELDGVSVVERRRKRLEKQYIRNINTLEPELRKQVGWKINVRSPKDIKKFVEEDLGLKLPYDRRTHRQSGNEDALTKLLLNHRPELLKLIVDLRSLKTILSGYINIDLAEDKRIHCHYGYTESQRLKSSASILGSGMNLQTPPRTTRFMYVIDDPAFLFGQYDLSQAEDRVVAWAGPVPKKMELYNSGKRVHVYFASIISDAFVGHHVNYEDVIKDSSPGTLYFTAKRTVLGNNLGLGPEKFSMYAQVSLKEAKLLQDIYHGTFPEVKQRWWKDIEDQLRKDRTLTLPDGSRRMFLARWGDDLLRGAYAHFAQEVVCYHMNQTIVCLYYAHKCALDSRSAYEDYLQKEGLTVLSPEETYRALIESQLKIKLQVHDECVYQGVAETIPYIAQIPNAAANRPIKGLKGGSFVIPAEHGLGFSWGRLKGFKPNDEKAHELVRHISQIYSQSRKSRSVPLVDSSNLPRSSN